MQKILSILLFFCLFLLLLSLGGIAYFIYEEKVEKERRALLGDSEFFIISEGKSAKGSQATKLITEPKATEGKKAPSLELLSPKDKAMPPKKTKPKPKPKAEQFPFISDVYVDRRTQKMWLVWKEFDTKMALEFCQPKPSKKSESLPFPSLEKRIRQFHKKLGDHLVEKRTQAKEEQQRLVQKRLKEILQKGHEKNKNRFFLLPTTASEHPSSDDFEARMERLKEVIDIPKEKKPPTIWDQKIQWLTPLREQIAEAPVLLIEGPYHISHGKRTPPQVTRYIEYSMNDFPKYKQATNVSVFLSRGRVKGVYYDDIGIHDYPQVPAYAASHGCVRSQCRDIYTKKDLSKRSHRLWSKSRVTPARLIAYNTIKLLSRVHVDSFSKKYASKYKGYRYELPTLLLLQPTPLLHPYLRKRPHQVRVPLALSESPTSDDAKFQKYITALKEEKPHPLVLFKNTAFTHYIVPEEVESVNSDS